MIGRRRIHNLYFGAETWVYIVVALAMGFLIPQVKGWVFAGWTSPVDKETMSTILSSIASGMITLSGLVFSLIFVLVQFGSATYSPRITRIFAHSRVLHHSLGIFTGTFLYSLMSLRTIGMGQAGEVHGLTIWIAFIWLLVSIGTLARLVGVFGTLTVTNILTALGNVGRQSIARVYGGYAPNGARTGLREAGSGPGAADGRVSQRVIYEGGPVYVNFYDTPSLAALALKNDAIICLPYAIGDALKDGAEIALVRGKGPAVPPTRVFSAILLERERSFGHDPKYAIRLLVDTAIRALSPAVNDPTTAVQALDHIESLLRRLGDADLEIGEVRDRRGALRVVYKTPRWEDFLQLGLSEILLYGSGSIQVERRLEALLDFLAQALPLARAEAVSRFRDQRQSLSAVSFKDATFRRWADIGDREGIGGGDGRP